MVRNVILFVATAGALIGLFLGYQRFTAIPAPELAERPDAFQKVTAASDAASGAIVIESDENRAAIAPSDGRTEFTLFDETTGRPTQAVRLQKWRKVADTKNEVEVEGLEVTLYLNRGMEARISADRGRFVGEGLEKNQPRPKRGWLEGNARIVLTRPESGPAPDPATAATAAAATTTPRDTVIDTDRLEFDVERNEVRAVGELTLRGDEFDLNGRDLKLIWNQADNRVELLELRGAGRLELKDRRDPLANVSGSAEPGPASAPAAFAPDPGPSDNERVTTYWCALTGGVKAERLVNDQPAGALEADDLQVLFDVGKPGAAEAEPTAGEPPAASAPAVAVAPANASQPAESTPRTERRVVTWSDGLTITPKETRPANEVRDLRVRVDARGEQVLLRMPQVETGVGPDGQPLVTRGPDRVITCGGLRFHADTSQLWLAPSPARPIEFTLGNGLAAVADSVFADLNANRIKLVGNVALSRTPSLAEQGSASGGRSFRVNCSLWAELRLSPSADETDSPPAERGDSADLAGLEAGLSGGGRLESAVFVGDVRIRSDGDQVRAQRVEARFAAPAAVPTVEPIAGSTSAPAVAAASQPPASPADSGDPLALELESVTARGRVEVRAGAQTLHTTWLQAGYTRDAAGQAYLSDVRALGAVKLRDDEEGVSIDGRELLAQLTPDSDLVRADVLGTARRPARAIAQGYDVRGPRIALLAVEPAGTEAPQPFARNTTAASSPAGGTPADAREPAYVLDVPGPAELRFDSERGLRGQARRGTQRVTVTAQRSLRVDTRPAVNTVEFSGDVQAISASERLEAATLTLLMTDVAPPPAARPEGLTYAWRVVQTLGDHLGRSALAGVTAARRGAAPADRPAAAVSAAEAQSIGRRLLTPAPGRSIRKEPVRLTAADASVTSDSYAPGRPDPVATQTIEAPQLVVELGERRVRTNGETTLSMTSRRLEDDPAPSGPNALGLPSSLISRGPSQTFLQCRDSMNYVVGEDGPARSDRVLFEGEVVFVHAAGRKMTNITQVIPALANQPERLATLGDRYTRMYCNQLEVVLDMGGGPATASAPAGERPADRIGAGRLALLNATGNVNLLDEHGGGLREIQAHQVEFDQKDRIVKVYGNRTANQPAVVTYENKAQNRFDRPATGYAFRVFLETNTIQSEDVRGEFRR